MKTLLTAAVFSILVLFYSCSSSKIITSWKASNDPRNYHKIMVVGIIKDSGVVLRSQMEAHLVNDLKNLGYNAVSALSEFGKGGLANMEQEDTYIKLCNKGIDAVITVALLDR